MGDLGAKSVYRFGDFTLDMGRRSLIRDGEGIPLSPKEFLALSLLVEAGGRAVPRETLVAAIWPDTAVSDNSLARNVSSLRRRLGAGSIEVVPKFGYRFALPVSLAAPPAEASPQAPAQTETQAQDPAALSSDPARERRRLTTLPAWIWGSVAAILLLGTLGATRVGPLKARASTGLADDSPTWTDPQTKLSWTRSDNNADITRQQAINYCGRLGLTGHHDWRLPTIDELQTLYDTGVSIGGTWGPTRPVYWHVKGDLHLTGGETAENLTWLTDLTPAGEEQSYDFSYGRRNYDADGFEADHRALCVRP